MTSSGSVEKKKKKKKSMPSSDNSGYVTHSEFQSGLDRLAELFNDGLSSLRKEFRSDISHGRVGAPTMVGVVSVFVMVLGMAAALVAYSMEAAVAPLAAIDHYHTDILDRIVAKMDKDDDREQNDAKLFGEMTARIASLEAEIKSGVDQCDIIVSLVDAKMDGQNALFADQIDQLRKQGGQ